MKDFRVRVEVEMNVSAETEGEAIRIACQDRGVSEDDCKVVANVLRLYRMPVMYTCCEEGRSYGYDYIYAKDRADARRRLQDGWTPDIEACPDFDGIEEQNDEGEWY